MIKKNRLEAFNNGILVIIITIMVLSIKTSATSSLSALIGLLPKFISYLLSFAYIGIYWNNRRQMFTLMNKFNGQIVWANLNLLFWMLLIPFATGWMVKADFSGTSVVLYGIILLVTAAAYRLLEQMIIRFKSEDSKLKKFTDNNQKEKIAIVLYFTGIICAFSSPLLAFIAYIAVAASWIIPDKRIEKNM